CKDFVASCIQVGIPYSPDFNTSRANLPFDHRRKLDKLIWFRDISAIIKAHSFQVTYVDDHGERVSSESAYLTEEVLSRPNLLVALHAQVTRILFDPHAEGGPRAIGVEFSKTQEGPRYRAHARKEVILRMTFKWPSAGAIHSPQILLLSGVGDKSHLEDLQVDVIHDLPSVGTHLVDHPVIDLAFKDKNATPKYIKPNSIYEVIKLIGASIFYLINRTGSLSTNVAESVAFVRSDDPKLFPPNEYAEEIHDTTSGEDGPDLELFSTVFGYKVVLYVLLFVKS
ncbi:hypothetical protein H0H93_013736, partial [Arthromyces matolae]